MKITLLLGFIALVAAVNGQPVLQESNFMLIGLSGSASGGRFAPGPAGANQTWDFSAITVVVAGPFTCVNPSSSPCSANFSSSNYCWITPGPQYSYYNRTSTALEAMGENIQPSCTGGKTFSDYKQVLKFPFNYTDTYTDSYVHNTGSGSPTYTYDGYGTLKTPYGTYNNTIRVKSDDGSTTTYNWYTSDNPSYLLMVSSPTQTIVLSDVVTAVQEQLSAGTVSVFPVPFSVKAVLKTDKDLKDAMVRVYNVYGQAVKEIINISGQAVTIDRDNLQSGFYFIQLSEDSNVLSTVKIIITD